MDTKLLSIFWEAINSGTLIAAIEGDVQVRGKIYEIRRKYKDIKLEKRGYNYTYIIPNKEMLIIAKDYILENLGEEVELREVKIKTFYTGGQLLFYSDMDSYSSPETALYRWFL